MSKLFGRIGQAVKKALGLKPDAIQKLDVLSRIESLSTLSTSMADVFNNPKTVAKLQLALRAPKGSPKTILSFQEVYRVYISDLSSALRSAEHASAFSTIGRSATRLNAGLIALGKAFATIFDEDGSEIDPTSLNVSQAMALGYLDNAQTFLTWTSYVLNMGLSDLPGSAEVPPYQEEWAMVNLGSVVKFVTSLFNLLPKTTIVDQIQKVRSTNRDAALATNGNTLDQYASENDYTGGETVSLDGFMRSPALMIGQKRINWERSQADQLKQLQNWLRNKITLLQLNLARTNPDDPTYRHTQKLVENYMKDLSDTARKLSQYESV